MYINTFKYTPADVDCKLCTEYVKKFGCTACGCPWMAERIEAGVVGYSGYRQARDEMKELLTVKANVDRIMGYEEEKQTEKDHAQEQSQGR